MPGPCGWCNTVNAKLWCSRCKHTFYCGTSCQRAHWNQHKLQCTRHILKKQKEFPRELPKYPVIHEICKDRLKLCHYEESTKKFRNLSDLSKSYTDIYLLIDLDIPQILEEVYNILISAKIFYVLESLNIEFESSGSRLNGEDQTNLDKIFYVISRLPKLSTLRVDDISECNPVCIQIKIKFFQSFSNTSYQSLRYLIMSIDDVFHHKFDYSQLLIFIANSRNLRSINLSLKLWSTQSNSYEPINYQTAVSNFFTSILKRSRGYVDSLETFAFEIKDLSQPLDIIDATIGESYLTFLIVLLSSQQNLKEFTIAKRPFSPVYMARLWECIKTKCDLRDLVITDFQPYPIEKCVNGHEIILDLIKTQKNLEFLMLRGYLLWTPRELSLLIDTVYNNCKHIVILRPGWIHITRQTDWKILMKVFNRHSLNLILFHAYKISVELVGDSARNAITDGIIQNVRNYNDYMINCRKILEVYYDKQKCIAEETLKYLGYDEEIDHKLQIVIVGHWNYDNSFYTKMKQKAKLIEKHVNSEINAIKHELCYSKIFKFTISN
eukprot:347305_1